MLADVLDGMRDNLVDELVRRIAVTQRSRLHNGAQHARLGALVGEVITTLRRGSRGDAAPRSATACEPELELDEHEVVERYILEKIDRNRLETSPEEAALIHVWRRLADCRCLYEQNKRLRALLDDVNESTLLLAPDGRILYSNRRAAQGLYELSGVSPTELLGKTSAQLGVPFEAIVGRSVGELGAMAREHQRFEVNVLGRTKETQFDALYGPDGSIAAVALLMRDIHGRKQAQTRVGLLSKLSSLAGILEYDEVAQRLTAVPIPELADWCVVNVLDKGRIRRTFMASQDPSKNALLEALKRAAPSWERHPLWQELLAGGFQLLTEVSSDLLRKITLNDEQYRLLATLGLQSLLVFPLLSRGRTIGIVTLGYTSQSGRRYGRDDPALAEEFALHAAHALQNAQLLNDLKAGEARFRVALASARTVVFEQDASLRYTWYYNPLARGGPVGRIPEEALPSDEAERFAATKRQVLERGEGMEGELDLTLSKEERRHYREAIEPVIDHAGRVVGIIGAATDITEQQRMKEQLTEDLTFRERMMGVLGHDLRNPLNAITIGGEVLLRRTDMPPGAREQVLRIGRAAGRMKEMIDTLLDFTRVRSLGTVPLALVPADLGEIARAVLEEIRTTRPDCPVQLEVRGDTRGDWDPARLSQVISNLVSNGITYGQQGAPVTVAVEGSPHDVSLSVTNLGAPISPELMNVIFEPFRRGIPEDRSPAGLGMGLYIARQVVIAHAGDLSVQSTAAAGTTFTVRLPRVHAPAAVSPDTTGH